ncbi:MAG: class I SAM-dependent methyltransferase [Anaerolineae bacterium]
MVLGGPDFYDDSSVFETYRQHRSRADNPNDTLEKPITLELIGDVKDKRILDLGCGDGQFGRELFGKGCESYVGIEASQNMIKLARETLAGTRGEVIRARIEEWAYPPLSFDLVVSRLSIHYIENVDALFQSVHNTLTLGGRLVFSVEHPVITSCSRSYASGQGLRQDWIVDDYFNTGQRVTHWLGGQVVKYHRTVEDYHSALQNSGLKVETLRESHPQRAYFSTEATYERRKRIPLFLFLAASKN